jgi:prolyl oligopeptidase
MLWRHIALTLAIGLIAIAPVFAPAAERNATSAYPTAPTDGTVDEYHGTRVPDPYRPLEDPDSPESRAWIEAENKITFAFLESIPAREPLKARLTKLWDYEKFGVPERQRDRYFLTRNSGLQNQSVLYSMSSLDAEPQVLLDPNALSKDGTVALAGVSISDDGSKMAYALADAGSDWITWRVRNVATAQDTDDVVRWSKFSGASWTKDGQGFFYGRYPEP